MSVPQPIIILASPRSFTSLTSSMLGQHPEVYGVPELNLFLAESLNDLLQQFRDQAKFRKIHGLLRTVAQLYAGEQSIDAVNMAHRWILRRLQNNTGDIFVELCEKVKPLRILDKSPAYCLDSEVLRRIDRTFPEAHYIHLIRHPRAQGESVMKLLPQTRKGKSQRRELFGSPNTVSPNLLNCLEPSGDSITIDFQFLWYRMQWRIIDFLSTIPRERQIRIRGEDLLSNPPIKFENLCRFLNLSWSNGAFQAMLHPEDSPYACYGPYGAQYGNDVNFLKSPTFRQRSIPMSSLEGSLPWRKDGGGFHPTVIKLAQDLGYK
ncbi:hypothetical protein DO97_16870 [Neosynechococcus sphagnicola sy1]|uniref:Sulfotransferase n=1 Tax=Neosynechococcus sphagnicola sy1 TaxID=1497020 RepID=A0A098TP38_9CYAN|nr:sulfotransferase [Neosynechococcus sphagnicola]KGF73637.1 hypothetical protein DO97_16870 [Neosynechococcus sphagnicola sy1]